MTEQTAIQSTQVRNKLVIPPKGSNYIAQAIQAKKENFVLANEGLDLDYVRLGTYLKISKKGNFVEAKDDTVSFGDTLDVVVAQGGARYTLWGKEKSPEDGMLIVSDPSESNACMALGQWLSENPERAEAYSQDDIDLRYTAFVVPVMLKDGTQLINPDDAPTIYLMSFAPGDTIGWGQYAMKIFDGKYKPLQIPAGIGANRVITRLTTEERTQKGTGNAYLGIHFEAVAVFNPLDFGITLDDEQVDAAVQKAEDANKAEATRTKAGKGKEKPIDVDNTADTGAGAADTK